MSGGHIQDAAGFATGSCVNELAVLWGPCLYFFPSRMVWLQDLSDELGVDEVPVADAYDRSPWHRGFIHRKVGNCQEEFIKRILIWILPISHNWMTDFNSSDASLGIKPCVGSSSIRILELDISQCPIASVCCSPPLKVPARCFLHSCSLGNKL